MKGRGFLLRGLGLVVGFALAAVVLPIRVEGQGSDHWLKGEVTPVVAVRP
jgi:hypothetical protein